MSLKKNLKKSVVMGALMAFVITGNAFAATTENTENTSTNNVFELTYNRLGIPNGFIYNGQTYYLTDLVNEDNLNALKTQMQEVANNAKGYKTVADTLGKYESVTDLLEKAQTDENAAADLATIKGALGITDDSKLEQAITNGQKYAELLDQVSKMEGLDGATSADKLANLIQNATANTEQLVQLNKNLGELVEFTNNVENAATTVANKIQEGVDFLKENEGAIKDSITAQVNGAKAEIQEGVATLKDELAEREAALAAAIKANQEAIVAATKQNQEFVKQEVKDALGTITGAIEDGVGVEAAIRDAADKALDAKIDAEVERATEQDKVHTEAIAANKSAIEDEVKRATEQDKVHTEAIAANKSAIEDEVERATEQDKVHTEAIAANGKLIADNSAQISGLNQRLGQLSGRVNKVGAGAAALAALHPLEYDPEDKLTFSAGMGNYAGENAAALGAFYRPNEKLMFSLGGTMGNGENMVNLGVSIGLDGATGLAKMSKRELIQKVNSMEAEMAELRALVIKLAADKK